MKLLAGWILTAAAIAHAEPSLDEYGSGDTPHPARQLVSAACSLDVQLHGAVATLELHERITNSGPSALAASYEFALPPGAVLIGAAVMQAGQADAPDPALAVAAPFSTTTVDPSGVLGPDPLIVQAIPTGSTGGEPRYRAVIQPIAPSHDVSFTLRYATVAGIRGSALHLVLPGRPADAGLAPCRGTLRATPGPNARIQGFRVAGADQSSQGSPNSPSAKLATFTLASAPVAIDVDLDLAGTEPIVWTQTENLGVGWSATLVTVLAPPIQPPVPRVPRGDRRSARALFVIDGSRSMDLVGRQKVAQVMHAIAAALPSGTSVDAILYDRTAARLLGDFRPPTPDTLAALDAGLQAHPAGNGSDLVAAFKLAHTALAGAPGSAIPAPPAMIILVTDGVLGNTEGAALSAALDSKPASLDVHAILLDPAHMRSPNADAIRGPIHRHGGTLVEVDSDDLDHALASVDDWLEPAALELSLGSVAIPDEVRAGSGFTRTYLHRDAIPALTLTGHRGHGEPPFRVAARPAPAAPIAQLALAQTTDENFTTRPEPSDADLTAAHQLRTRARTLHPAADTDHAFAVLAQAGKIAASRRAMIQGGGPYQRTVAVPDPALPPSAPTPAPTGPQPSAIAKITLERLFRDQLAPRAYACYQHALGRSPTLVATAYFEIYLGRGEVSQVTVSGTSDPAFEACLLAAAYALQPPFPDFTINADDQTLARYPLSFSVRDDHPIIMPGDADSSSPLDIDAIKGGVPERRRPIHVDAATPLGNLPRQK